MDADQVRLIFLNLLPILAPLIVEGLKKLQPKLAERAPWILKPVIVALIAALIGAITEYAGGAGGAVAGATIGMGSSVGYAIARPKIM